MRCAAFLDRDGILNREVREGRTLQPPCRLEDFELLPEAEDGVAALKAAGMLVIVTTNQPGISQGTLARRELDLMHRQLRGRLPVDDILVCPHTASDHCPCRKPKPGLLLEAAFRWHLDMDHSFVISKMWPDAEAAHVVGCTSLLVESPWVGSGHHDCVLPSLAKAVERILRLHERNHRPHLWAEAVKS